MIGTIGGAGGYIVGPSGTLLGICAGTVDASGNAIGGCRGTAPSNWEGRFDKGIGASSLTSMFSSSGCMATRIASLTRAGSCGGATSTLIEF
jgi:hypothetical protein